MSNYTIAIRAYGNRAVLIEWPNRVEEAILEDILRFTTYLKTNCLQDEVWEYIPAYNSLTLISRTVDVSFTAFKKQLKIWYTHEIGEILDQKRLWHLPVCYHLNFGIDLIEAASQLHLTPKELITIHTKQTYTVYGIGFLPGFMYLGGLPQSLEVPRKKTPRLRISPGAVGLAGKQTGIYPQESPGGWNIIGNCPIPIFDITKKDPCFVQIGDKIQFHSISKAAHKLHKIESEIGIYQLKNTKIDA